MDIYTPISDKIISELEPGDTIEITGDMLTGRDAVLPKVVAMIKEGTIKKISVDLAGGVIFHTAVSKAGVGPTSSNKPDIETSIGPLSEAGIKIHIGKGKLSSDTVKSLYKNNAVFAILPPITALLESKIISRRIVAFPEEGMEAMYLLKVKKFPAIIAVAQGKTVFDHE